MPVITHRKIVYPEGTSDLAKGLSFQLNLSFVKILVSFEKYLKDANIDITKLNYLLLNFIQFPAIKKTDKMVNIADIENLRDISKFMEIVQSYCSFFNFGCLVILMESAGFESGKKLMDDYKKEFADCVKQIAVRECPSGIGICSQDHVTFSVKLDEGFKECQQYYLSILKQDLCQILGVKTEHLYIHGVENGCICIVFHLLKFYKDKTFPIDDKQRKALQSLNYEGSQLIQLEHEMENYIINERGMYICK